MVLDGEQDESMRVFLEQRLVGFNLLDVQLSLGWLGGFFGHGLDGRVVNGCRDRGVLLACGFKVELLDRRFVHLEVLERGSSLSEISLHSGDASAGDET